MELKRFHIQNKMLPNQNLNEQTNTEMKNENERKKKQNKSKNEWSTKLIIKAKCGKIETKTNARKRVAIETLRYVQVYIHCVFTVYTYSTRDALASVIQPLFPLGGRCYRYFILSLYTVLMWCCCCSQIIMMHDDDEWAKWWRS